MPVNTDDRSLGEMFVELTREIRTLVQQEIQLARSELEDKASRMMKSAVLVAAGGLLAYGGLLAIVSAVVLGLIAIGLPAWAGALVGGLLIAGVGYLLIRSGLAAVSQLELKPRQTIETLKEDAQWLKSHTR